MDFNDTPQESQYRQQVRGWLDANAEGVKTTGASVFDARSRRGEADYVERAQEWQAKKTDAGYGVIQWPKEYGGAGGSTMQALIYREEEARYEVPAGVFDIGLGMCGPVLMMYADEGTKKRLLPEHGARPGHLVPALLRADRRLRPRRPAHARAARRRRLDRQRAEGVDLGRALLALRHPGHPPRSDAGQAQGPHLLLARHEEPRRRGEADPADLGLLQLQRGLLHQRPHPRLAASGRDRRGLAGLAHHADERALRGGHGGAARLQRDLRADAAVSRSAISRRSRARRCARGSPTGTSRPRACG